MVYSPAPVSALSLLPQSLLFEMQVRIEPYLPVNIMPVRDERVLTGFYVSEFIGNFH